jgi:hypothetical protein
LSARVEVTVNHLDPHRSRRNSDLYVDQRRQLKFEWVSLTDLAGAGFAFRRMGGTLSHPISSGVPAFFFAWNILGCPNFERTKEHGRGGLRCAGLGRGIKDEEEIIVTRIAKLFCSSRHIGIVDRSVRPAAGWRRAEEAEEAHSSAVQ